MAELGVGRREERDLQDDLIGYDVAGIGSMSKFKLPRCKDVQHFFAVQDQALNYDALMRYRILRFCGSSIHSYKW